MKEDGPIKGFAPSIFHPGGIPCFWRWLEGTPLFLRWIFGFVRGNDFLLRLVALFVSEFCLGECYPIYQYGAIYPQPERAPIYGRGRFGSGVAAKC